MYSSLICLYCVEDTENYANEFARYVGSGDTVILTGPIGAGKSVFARSLIYSICGPDNLHDGIPSPTYNLVQTYQNGNLEIWHADLYRIDSCWEVLELGLVDAFETGLCIVEWGERLEHLAPANALYLELSNPTESDQFRFLKMTTTNSDLLEQLWRIR